MKRKAKSQRKLAPRIFPTACLCCGEENPWVTQTLPQKSEFRDQLHEVRAEVMQCRYCAAITTTPEQTEALLQKLQEAHAQWISQTLKSTKRALTLSHRGFATAVNISSATLSRAIKAESLIDPSTEELLLIKIKRLKTAQEINELLDLPMAHKSSASYEPDGLWPLACSAADSEELPLSA